MFGLIWTAWLNGALSHEVSGRDDGQSRCTLFLQMLLLIVLAAFTEGAANDHGRGFAVSASLVFLAQGVVWVVAAREHADVHTRALATTFATGTLASAVAILASLALDGAARVVVWAIIVGVWISVLLVVERLRSASLALSPRVAGRMVERFGLITIVVLGEIVFGVINGFGRSEGGGFDTLVIGLLGLWIAFALWWNFFDFVGRAYPAASLVGPWMVTHLPIAAGMAAIGAATTQLTSDEAGSTAIWLLASAVITVLVAMAVRERALSNGEISAQVRRRFALTSVAGSAAVVAVGLVQPAVWLSMSLIITVLIIVWLATFEAWIDGLASAKLAS